MFIVGGRLVVGAGRRGIRLDTAVCRRPSTTTSWTTLTAADHVGRLLDGTERAAGDREYTRSGRRHYRRTLQQTDNFIKIFSQKSFSIITRNDIRSSAVAVIADRTAYDVWYIRANSQTGFGYKIMNGWYARSDSTGRVYERTQTLMYSSVTI